MATLRLAEQLDASTTVHRINTMIPAEASFGEKLRHYRKAAAQLSDALDQYPDALVIWTSISPETAGHWRDVLTVLPRLKGRRVIAVAHWGKFATVFENAATRLTARRLLRQLDRLVFTAPVLANACAPWIPEGRRAVIPNTLDGALIPPAEAVENRIQRGPSRPLKVLFLSNMIKEKGWEDVLEAAAKLSDEGIQQEWVFAGGWPHNGEEKRFHTRVRELDLVDQVRHLGLLQDKRDIAAAHLDADVFVLPSWLREAQPLSILEAMAAGTPCIVADDGGMPGMIGLQQDDGHDSEGMETAGIVVPTRKPNAIASAILRLSEPDTWERHARSARERFDAHFAPEVVTGQWTDLIADVLSDGGAR